MRAPFSARPASRKWVMGLALVAIPLFGFDRGCVTEPQTDILVTTATKTIRGNIGRYDDSTLVWQENVAGSARLRVNGGAFLPWTATGSGNLWEFPNVALSLGVNVLDGETKRSTGSGTVNGPIDDFILERKNDLFANGSQPVFLDWSTAGLDAEIKAIATSTLSTPLTPAQQAAFVADVKTGIRNFFTNAYANVAVTLVEAPGTGVHTVKFLVGTGCNLFGESPGDYKNTNKTQTTKIYLHTFRCVMEDRLISTTPAELTDSVATRVEDVSTAIGRTVAHEVGHSLGLTADGEAYLHGCEGFHNCEAYDDAHPADRFDVGHHIMDAGPKSELFARIGQSNPNTRSKKTPYFEKYGKSYLQIIHP
ncbi:hypothetical protein JY651_39650 [Pyxidicoccus parkwayensis]|uniref:Peptidase M10 metallopeptidase domain-containing protein n=1 Tax=Pyxidicoccus parkwayensis TaxID=2813578 RepID=A0ABX7NSB9_9BACT|nr:hypothetical protein [Pyxidicoccus parkwaysis]QSQ21249.1 hypothetical protein JY651_39650 [Pyxidicoccus parkwaysis]